MWSAQHDADQMKELRFILKIKKKTLSQQTWWHIYQQHTTQGHHNLIFSTSRQVVTEQRWTVDHTYQPTSDKHSSSMHAFMQQAAVCMLNHPSQLKSLLPGSKLPDSDLLLTSNPAPDKPFTTTPQSAFFLQHEES